MNPIWAIFFKDRFKTPFSVYRMSVAEVVFLLAAVGAIGYGLSIGVQKIIALETTEVIMDQPK